MIKWRPTAEHFRLLGIGTVLAGIVHVLATFAMPALTGSRSIQRFAATLPENQLRVLPPITQATQPLPFLAPESLYAVCRYDTSKGPVAVSVTLPDLGWVMALYSMDGDDFYHVTGQATRRTNLSLLLVPPSEQLIGVSAEAQTGGGPSGAPLTVAARQGILLLKGPIRGGAYRHEVETELRKARCGLRRT